MFGLGKRKSETGTDDAGPHADVGDGSILLELSEEISGTQNEKPETAAIETADETASMEDGQFNELSDAGEAYDRSMEPLSEEETRATFIPASASAESFSEFAEAEETPLSSDLTVLTSAELLVGPGTRLKGDVTTCEAVSVQGNLEGTVDAGRLTISETGDVDGTATLETAEIGGKFNGTLTVRGLLTIRSTGVVQGTVRYGELELERGCQVSGDVALNSDRGESGSLIQLRRPARP